ncbi:MAG: FtsX-like permease family protein, partial [Acidobacteriaceae bacterium]|nr:FtsX-like permease family protein [Acidobacteriaceae bacterium]
RIMRQLLSENLLLAIPGAALGAVLAFGLSPLLVNLLPAARGFDQYVSPRVLTVTPDLRVLCLTAALCIFCVLVFGILPAIRATRFDLHSELKAGGRAATGSIAGVGPIAVQVALSVVLLATSSLMLRTFWKLEHLNPGFDRPHIVAFTLQPSTAGYSTAQTGVLLRQLDQQVSALPGVRGSGYATRGVMRTIGIMSTVAPQGVVLPRTTFLNTSLNNVSPGYFDAMGIPLLAGRGLEPEDRTKKPSPIVVNRAFADLLFPKQNAVGKFIVQGVDGRKPPTAQIVGIVGSAKYRSMRENPPPTYYELFDEETDNAFVLYVRTFGDPVRIIRSVRSLLFKLDSGLPIMEISTLEQEVQNSLWQERLVAWLAAFFGVVAVVLAALGVYGALAYSVARRSRELGIRVAIGARFQHVIQAVCGRMVWSAGIGLASGVLLSVVMLGITRRLLYGIDPLDPVSLLAAGLIVVSCIAFAAFLPSRRAAHTDPSLVLRIE